MKNGDTPSRELMLAEMMRIGNTITTPHASFDMSATDFSPMMRNQDAAVRDLEHSDQVMCLSGIHFSSSHSSSLHHAQQQPQNLPDNGHPLVLGFLRVLERQLLVIGLGECLKIFSIVILRDKAKRSLWLSPWRNIVPLWVLSLFDFLILFYFSIDYGGVKTRLSLSSTSRNTIQLFSCSHDPI